PVPAAPAARSPLALCGRTTLAVDWKGETGSDGAGPPRGGAAAAEPFRRGCDAMSRPDQSSSPAVDETHQWAALEAARDLSGVTLGDFQVEGLLGRGGMGEVYLARQISLNRPVALKVLRSDLLTRPTYLSRFEAEAAAVAKLNHPNIVHVYTLGCVDGIRFIAMEYVQGTNLRDYLAKK